VLYSLFPQSVSKFSLVYLLAWYPPLHTPYISSPNHCLLFAAQPVPLKYWDYGSSTLCVIWCNKYFVHLNFPVFSNTYIPSPRMISLSVSGTGPPSSIYPHSKNKLDSLSHFAIVQQWHKQETKFNSWNKPGCYFAKYDWLIPTSSDDHLQTTCMQMQATVCGECWRHVVVNCKLQSTNKTVHSCQPF